MDASIAVHYLPHQQLVLLVLLSPLHHLAHCRLHLHREVEAQAQEGVVAFHHRVVGFGCITGELDGHDEGVVL